MKDIEFPSLLIGLAGLSFMLSMIATFIQKWVYEKGVKNKSIQNGSRQKNNYFEREKIEKMKNKKLILVIILLLAIVFYWFAYRPSSIKRNCMEAAKRGSHQDLVKEFGAAKDTSGFYTNCLHINGL